MIPMPRTGPLRALVCLFTAGVAACGPPAVRPTTGGAPGTSPAPPTSSSSDSSLSSPAPGDPFRRVLPPDVDFELTVAPDPSAAGAGAVTVTLAARAFAAPLTVWQSAKPIALASAPEVSDEIGSLPATVDASGGATRLTLSRAPSGTTWVRYTVRADLPAYPDPPAISLDPDRFEAAGEALLLLPVPLEDQRLRAVARVETAAIGTSELTAAASTLGLGSRVEATVRGADLRETFFVAGLLGRATFLAPEGNDDAAWLGYTAFDPRPVVADMAGFRTALRQLFGAPDADKLTFLFLADSRPASAFLVGRRPRSVVVRVGLEERWSAPLRIAVAASVIHGWIGSRLWVGPSEPSREAEAYWFTEGVTRHLARDLLLRYGLISPAESAAEVEGLAAVLATSPLASSSNATLAKLPRGALPLLIARGALYALRTDAVLRAKTAKKRTLENVLRDLYVKAAAEKGPLPATAWTDVLAKDLDSTEIRLFHDAIELGQPFDLPDSSLGPCFRRTTRSYVAFDLGFDEDATLRSTPRRITGLVKGGPAERAGLKEGAELFTLRIDHRSPDSPVILTLPAGDSSRTLTYKPEGPRAKGPGFDRKKDLPDDACTP